MSFHDLGMLWLIWTVPILFLVCFWGLRRRRRILAGFSTPRGLSAICPNASATRRWLKAGLLLTVLLLLTISLAGPQYGYRWREIERRGVDLLVVIDCSKSMLATDIQPTRLDRAKREVVDLLNLLQGDRVGLVAFSGTAFLQCPLTLDYEAFHLFLGALTPGFLPVGGTDLALAVRTALAGFNKRDVSDKAVILITDGESTGQEDPLKAAQAAVDAKVRLFCVGVGATDGVPIPAASGGFVKDTDGNIVLTRLDEAILKKMAIMTGGSYVRSVAGDMDLETIYTKHIRKDMTRATLSQQKKKILEDRYQWFLAVAVLMMGIELFIPLARKTGLVIIALWFLSLGTVADAANTGQLVRDGKAAYEAGDYDKAMTHFIDAQLEAPDMAEIHYNIGNTQYRAGDFNSALNHYKQALAAEDQALRQKAHYNMGNTLFRLGRYKEALKSYASALKIDSMDKQAEENMAFVEKVMAQPKPPQQGDKSKDDSSQDESKNENDGNKPSSGDREQDKENKPSPEKSREDSPKEKSRPTDDTKADAPGAAPEPKPEDSTEKKSQAGQASEDEDKQMDAQARQQAEKMLNRLEDMPGKALMPSYRERHIKKDW